MYLLRHGDALESGYDDVLRPLSSHGEGHAAFVAEMLSSSNIVIDRILSSPLLRAKQTASIIQEKLGIKKFEVTEYLVPGTDQRQLIQQLNMLSDHSVLLVGHEPLLHTFITVFAGDGEALRVELRKGTLVCMDIQTPFRRGGGELKWVRTTDQMREGLRR